MPRLIDFDPRWIDLGGRRGLGFLYRCTTGHCDGLNMVLFANPIDGGPPCELETWPLRDALLAAGLIDEVDGRKRMHRGCGKFRWKRTGETFETLTLSPSVNSHECGHFTVNNGGW